MSIRIGYEKKIVNGEIKEFKITKIVALTKDQLPEKYLEDVRSFYFNKESNSLVCDFRDFRDNIEHDRFLVVGETYSKDLFYEILKFIRKSGKELRMIKAPKIEIVKRTIKI